ncbi:immunity 53 family protein [Acidicapsa acidisoli]|uniref:immunity 53 family protein n=1 Tax=Acidicapsa acidisoli TaxID=1615681 RepID=UPI0037BE6815
MDSLAWLQNWYTEQCDGDWEHANGVQIDTLDNPGWSVNINLQDTRYSEVLNAVIVDENVGDSDWIVCRIVDGKSEGRGDSQKLLVIVQRFRSWIDNF